MGILLYGIDVPFAELTIIFSIVVVIYLIIIEIEFRQLRIITRKFDEEEIQLGHAMKELKDEFTALKDLMASKRAK